MKLLLVSFHFPPSRAARSLQLGKLTRQLIRLGVELDVVTVSPADLTHDAVDPRVGAWVESPLVRLHPVASPPRKGMEYFRAAAYGENVSGWRWLATQKALALASAARPGEYRALVTCSSPIDSHYVGLALKRRNRGLPWIIHFSDPWSGNPYIDTHPLRRMLLARCERTLCRNADMVLSVSEELTRHFAERNGGRAIYETLHHVFDPEQYPADRPAEGGRFLLRYLGGFSTRRSPQPLISAVDAAHTAGADLSRLHIDFVGEKMEDVAARLNAIHPGLATADGSVPYAESLRKMCTASALLLIDADQEFSPYFPSKLADYFGAARPIIAVSPAHSCTTRLVREFGGAAFGHNDRAAFAALIERICREGQAALPAPPTENVRAFEAETLARRFVELVERT